VRRKQAETLIRAFVPRKLRARSGLKGVLFGWALSYNWAGVGKSWGRLLYADERRVARCWGGVVRSV
jgi:hypothetical protein